MKSIAIIGAGITGISAARMLQDSFTVHVYESQEKCGGLIRCDRVNDILYHKVGGHVFNTKSERIKIWLQKFINFDKDLKYNVRNAQILFEDNLIQYPIENSIYQLPEKIGKKIIRELMELSNFSDTKSFENFLKTTFGNTLYEIYFQPYNYKIWKQPLDSIPIDWLEGKLPMPDRLSIFLNNIYRKKEKNMVHSTFFYPRHNGSQFWIERIGKGLHLTTQCRIEKLRIDGHRIRLNDLDTLYDCLIFTGDIRKFPEISVADDDMRNLLDSCKNLRTRGLTNALCECDETDISWLYLPNSQINAHRVIYTGNFSKSNNGNISKGRSTCVVEFEYGTTKREINHNIKSIPGNLKLIDTNSERNAYIVQAADTRAMMQHVSSQLKQCKIFLAGRFAEWEYYNMDKCIERAMKLSIEIKQNFNN